MNKGKESICNTSDKTKRYIFIIWYFNSIDFSDKEISNHQWTSLFHHFNNLHRSRWVRGPSVASLNVFPNFCVYFWNFEHLTLKWKIRTIDHRYYATYTSRVNILFQVEMQWNVDFSKCCYVWLPYLPSSWIYNFLGLTKHYPLSNAYFLENFIKKD